MRKQSLCITIQQTTKTEAKKSSTNSFVVTIVFEIANKQNKTQKSNQNGNEKNEYQKMALKGNGRRKKKKILTHKLYRK